LYYYGARWYDPYISRFTQPDTIVPDPADPQGYNRFSYVNNNPLNLIDPSGHGPTGPKNPRNYDRPTDRPEMNLRYVQVSTTSSSGFAPGDQVPYEDRGDNRIEGIIMHKTATADNTGRAVIDYFPSSGFSANYVIDTDGTIYMVVPDEYTAYTSGGLNKATESVWTTSSGHTYRGNEVNQHSIGIEVVGYTSEKYTEKQEDSATALVGYLAGKHYISQQDITAHSVVSREGKRDGEEYLYSLQQEGGLPNLRYR